jgi:hypothetical protein
VDLNRREFEFLYLLAYCKGYAFEHLVGAQRFTLEGRGVFIDPILPNALRPWNRLRL